MRGKSPLGLGRNNFRPVSPPQQRTRGEETDMDSFTKRFRASKMKEKNDKAKEERERRVAEIEGRFEEAVLEPQLLVTACDI